MPKLGGWLIRETAALSYPTSGNIGELLKLNSGNSRIPRVLHKTLGTNFEKFLLRELLVPRINPLAKIIFEKKIIFRKLIQQIHNVAIPKYIETFTNSGCVRIFCSDQLSNFRYGAFPPFI